RRGPRHASPEGTPPCRAGGDPPCLAGGDPTEWRSTGPQVPHKWLEYARETGLPFASMTLEELLDPRQAALIRPRGCRRRPPRRYSDAADSQLPLRRRGRGVSICSYALHRVSPSVAAFQDDTLRDAS